MDFYQYHDNCTIIPSSYDDDSLPNFSQALELVGSNHSFVDFKLDITEEEKLIFEQLTANSTSEYYQPNTSEFQPKYTEYLKSIGNTDELSSHSASILARLINSYMTQVPAMSITGSSWAPTFIEEPIFWHIDGAVEDGDIRVAITLKGPSTMFCNLEETRRLEELDIVYTIMDAYSKATTHDEEIAENEAIVKASASLPTLCSAERGHKIHQPGSYLGTVFVAGKTGLSAMHTVPTMTKEARIFLSLWEDHPI